MQHGRLSREQMMQLWSTCIDRCIDRKTDRMALTCKASVYLTWSKPVHTYHQVSSIDKAKTPDFSHTSCKTSLLFVAAVPEMTSAISGDADAWNWMHRSRTLVDNRTCYHYLYIYMCIHMRIQYIHLHIGSITAMSSSGCQHHPQALRVTNLDASLGAVVPSWVAPVAAGWGGGYWDGRRGLRVLIRNLGFVHLPVTRHFLVWCP